MEQHIDGRRLRAEREAAGLTVGALAVQTRATAQHIERIEAGAIDDSPALARALEKALGLAEGELTGGVAAANDDGGDHVRAGADDGGPANDDVPQSPANDGAAAPTFLDDAAEAVSPFEGALRGAFVAGRHEPEDREAVERVLAEAPLWSVREQLPVVLRTWLDAAAEARRAGTPATPAALARWVQENARASVARRFADAVLTPPREFRAPEGSDAAARPAKAKKAR